MRSRTSLFAVAFVLACWCGAVLAGHCPDETLYGNATAGSGGFVPLIETSGGNSEIGNSQFEIHLSQGLGGARGFLLIGATQGGLPIGGMGVDLNVLPPWMIINFVLNNAGIPGAGQFKLSSPIPDDPTLVGIDVYSQAIIVDAGAAKGFSATRGMHFVICAKN
ncbi:MAG: hypothetical protein AB1486_21810 [Planctomycetota bacterium]